MRTQLLRGIERSLVAETRLAGALLQERQTDGSVQALDREADDVGGLISVACRLGRQLALAGNA